MCIHLLGYWGLLRLCIEPERFEGHLCLIWPSIVSSWPALGHKFRFFSGDAWFLFLTISEEGLGVGSHIINVRDGPLGEIFRFPRLFVLLVCYSVEIGSIQS